MSFWDWAHLHPLQFWMLVAAIGTFLTALAVVVTDSLIKSKLARLGREKIQ